MTLKRRLGLWLPAARGTGMRGTLRIFPLIAAALVCASIPALPAQDSPTSPRVVQVGPKVHQTEHCLFLVEDDGRVVWPDAGSVFSPANLERYFTLLTTQFPGQYDSVCFVANNLTQNDSLVYVARKFKAAGINSPGTPGAPQSFASVDYSCYSLGEDSVTDDSLRRLDGEIGHAWGVNVLNQNAGHWWAASTVDCQLGGGMLSGPTLIRKIYGNPDSGFRWRGMDARQSDHQQTFSEQQLYLMGLHPTLPTFHVFGSPVFNADHTLSFASSTTYDHATVLATQGPRNPDYKQSPKQFKVAFVYIVRNEAEIYNNTFGGIEQAILKYCTSDDLSWGGEDDSLVPFLCATRYRASIDCVLADLDGNRRPALTVTDTYVASTDGTATVRFTASDPDGPVPTVALVPTSSSCIIQGNTVQIAGLPDGVHFFTLRAQDTAGATPFGYWNRKGKKVYAHFVVEVKRPASAVSFVTQPEDRTVTACATASFSVVASGTATSYQWYLQAAGTSTWNCLSEGYGYAGTTTATLTVTTSVTMDGDRFLCVANGGATTSEAATLTVLEQAPLAELHSSQAGSGYHLGVDYDPVYFSVFCGWSPEVTGYCTYQWQCKPAATGIWANVVDGFYAEGSTSASLRVYVRTMNQNGDTYRCVVTNTVGSTTSAEEALGIQKLPVVTVSPMQLTAWAGDSAAFRVTATGTGPFTYQWFHGDNPIVGATSDTLAYSRLTGSEGGFYSVVVTNSVGSSSASCVLFLHIPLPTITAPPADAAVIVGGTARFTVGASSLGYPGFGFLNFMWECRPAGSSVWTSVDNQFRVTPELTISNTTLAMTGGQYRCVVASQEGWTYSPAATLTVTSAAGGSPAGGSAVRFDTDHNGSVDLLWTNTTTGRRVIWLMNGTTWTNQIADLGVVGISWTPNGVGDFDGNGSTDILWSQAGTGRRVIWLMNGKTWTGQIADLGVVSTDWSINGVGDFDGNGSTDIVWSQASTGRRVVWIMSGMTWTRQAAELGIVSTDWSISGIADFDGNGSPDMVWSQASTGRRIIWLMSGTTRLNVPAVELGTVPMVWQLDGASDLDGDGSPDLIWTNTSTGRRIAWMMTGTRWLNSRLTELGTVPLFWTLGNH